MPITDYTDPEIRFPQLEARVQKREPDAFWITIWLRNQAGSERQKILNGKQAGSYVLPFAAAGAAVEVSKQGLPRHLRPRSAR